MFDENMKKKYFGNFFNIFRITKKQYFSIKPEYNFKYLFSNNLKRTVAYNRKIILKNLYCEINV